MTITKPFINKKLREYVVDNPQELILKKFSSDYKESQTSKILKKSADNLALQVLEESIACLIPAQEKLWACKKYGVLVVLQGMDTAGKDGAIRHILSGVNTQGCRVEGFKVPTPEEHAHNFLWRYQKVVPKRGEIVIFNRSHYEDVLAVKVHPDYLEQLPEELAVLQNKNFWDGRYEDINGFEKHLARNGILVLKFFLHISKAEQKKRLLDRLALEEKNWKVSPSDLSERKFWDKYVNAYQDAIAKTGHPHAPWIVVPANDKKIARAMVAKILADAINDLAIDFPHLSESQVANLQQAKLDLENEKD